MADIESLSDYEESFTEEQHKSHELHLSRSFHFHQSMSLFLKLENFVDSSVRPYVAFPKLRWSTSSWKNEDNDAADVLNELTNIRWTIFKVAPMYTFSYSSTHLKRYSALIKKAFESKNVLCEGYQDTINVTFKVIEAFSSSEFDAPGVQILVKSSLKDSCQILYKGYLISWKNKKNSNNTSEVKLPVLLCCCKDKTAVMLVHSTMQRLFDTSIEQVVFPQDDFMCFSILITGYLEEDNSSEVSFVYHVPERPKDEVLTFRVALTKLIDLWNRIIDVETNFVPVKKLLDYQLSLENHIENVYRVYLEKTHYSSMLVSNQVVLHADGKIKFKSPKVLNILLKYLTNKS